METITWNIEQRKTKELSTNEYNPRKMSKKQHEELCESIKQFGNVVPVVINIGSRNNILIGGAQRLKVYKELKIEELSCVVPSRELTLEEEQELNLRLNKNQGEWSYDLLKEFNLNILLDVGFDDSELQNIFDDVEVLDDDFNIEKAVKETPEAKVKLGEIWQLGSHKLLVGDSTNKELVSELMKNEQADIIYLDPPYNIGVDYSKGISSTNNYGGSFSSKDDSKSPKDYKVFLDKVLENALHFVKPNAHLFFWCDSFYIGAIQSLYSERNIENKRVCMWIKNNHNPTHKIAFNKVYEPCVYGIIGKPYINEGMQGVNEILNQELTNGNQLHDEISEMIDLWIVKRDSVQSYQHPTQKPVTLNERPFKRCSAPGHTVFSGFGGSGSDLIACEQLQRKWRGVEIDPVFATIIIERWEKFTNQKAERIYEHN